MLIRPLMYYYIIHNQYKSKRNSQSSINEQPTWILDQYNGETVWKWSEIAGESSVTSTKIYSKPLKFSSFIFSDFGRNFCAFRKKYRPHHGKFFHWHSRVSFGWGNPHKRTPTDFFLSGQFIPSIHVRNIAQWGIAWRKRWFAWENSGGKEIDEEECEKYFVFTL